MSDDHRYDGLLRAAEEAVCLPAGTLTVAGFRKALDEMWNAGLAYWPGAPSLYDEAEVVVVTRVKCGATALAPDESLKNAAKWECITRGIAVHPVEAAYLNSPVQGPTPLRCELEEHPAGTWHRDGRTWFR